MAKFINSGKIPHLPISIGDVIIKNIFDTELTFKKLEDAEKLVSWGVDFITSNILEGQN